MSMGGQKSAGQGRHVLAGGPDGADADRLQCAATSRKPAFPVVRRCRGPIVSVPGRMAEGQRCANSIASGRKGLVQPHR
jgi:hypothetical protein